jgi:hypothetical protein
MIFPTIQFGPTDTFAQEFIRTLFELFRDETLSHKIVGDCFADCGGLVLSFCLSAQARSISSEVIGVKDVDGAGSNIALALSIVLIGLFEIHTPID